MLNQITSLTTDSLGAALSGRMTGVMLLFAAAFSLIAYFAFGKREVLSDAARRNAVASVWTLIGNYLALPIIIWLVHWCSAAYDALHIPHLPSSTWEQLPPLLVALIGLVAKDLADYWNHRLMHMKWIWPIHAVHHSDTHVNGFTAFRVHFLEVAYMSSFYVLVLSWMGLPDTSIVLLTLLQSLHIVYVHFDLDISHGRLEWLLASPRFHRWHHADNPKIFGKNLANHIPLFDMIFGTYYNPGACHEPMGAESDNIPSFNVVKLMALPFTLWWKLVARLFDQPAGVATAKRNTT